MNILLTNDDGYNSKGINLLKKKLEKYGRVIIAAPKEAMSAKSVSITLGKGIEVSNPNKDIFIIDATPADCVEFALTMFDIKFDLIVSGCNDGLNISYDTIYSGTIGAGLQALKHRLPVICFSLDSNFEILDKYFDSVMDFIFKNNLLSIEYLLNVNFPTGEIVKDIRVSKLHYRKDYTHYINKDGLYFATRTLQEEECDKESDVYHVYHDIVSVTPLGKTNYNDSYYNELKAKIN